MTWPSVFDGRGALFVGEDNDPDVQAARIPGLTWVALKVNGADASPPDEQSHWVQRMRARGIVVGSWVYCDGPPDLDILATTTPWVPSFVVYDVEQPYKSDEGGHYEWAVGLVTLTQLVRGKSFPTAVTSYGSYKSSIDFYSFVRAGWPVFAQVYDGFKPGDEASYYSASGGIYPAEGVHRLTRSLSLSEGEAVYRPESIDG